MGGNSYDVRYNPQNHILTLDYPILEDLGEMCGIDEIYRYLECVKLEQFCGGEELTNYLLKDVKDFAAELMNAAEHGCIESVLGY